MILWLPIHAQCVAMPLCCCECAAADLAEHRCIDVTAAGGEGQDAVWADALQPRMMKSGGSVRN